MRVCFVGDSLVNGTGDPECLGWVGRVCAAARKRGVDLTCYNLGVRRETSDDILRRWRTEVGCRLPPEYRSGLVFSFGVNDTTVEGSERRVALGSSLRNARSVLSDARRLHPTLMVGPPPIADPEQSGRVADLSARLAAVCRELEVPYLEVFDRLAASGAWTSEVEANDGAHPRSAGYAELARLVEEWAPWQRLLAQTE